MRTLAEAAAIAVAEKCLARKNCPICCWSPPRKFHAPTCPVGVYLALSERPLRITNK